MMCFSKMKLKNKESYCEVGAREKVTGELRRQETNKTLFNFILRDPSRSEYLFKLTGESNCYQEHL